MHAVSSNIEEATKLKAEGNELFKQKEYRKAIRKYRTVFAYVNGLLDSNHELARYVHSGDGSDTGFVTEDQNKSISNLKVSCYSNLAQCYLNIDKPEKCVQCCEGRKQRKCMSIKFKYVLQMRKRSLERKETLRYYTEKAKPT